ncbi:MAG: DNA methyltransferase, partial [Kiloniellales bacterium]
MTSPVRTYLSELHEIHAMGAGTEEISLYNPLQNLLNEIGRRLKPKVFCIQNLKDLGAGFPDYGLYSANQLPKTEFGKLTPDIIAERGVIEAKAPREEVTAVAGTRQVGDYWERYGLVLVTNFRAFLIAGRDQFGRRENLEHFTLAETEDAFWALAARPSALSEQMETRCEEFLTRVLLHQAPLSQPRDVAWFLASYARDCLARLEGHKGELANLDLVRQSLEAALGITFEGPKGEHFFRSTLVQTLYYGLFSAWVLWCRQTPDPEERKGFSAAGAAWHLRLPVLRGLFEQINRPGALDPLLLHEVLEWAAGALRRIDDAAFFKRFREEHAVQYFYEPFLEAFDP